MADQAYSGAQTYQSGTSEFNTTDFMIRQVLARTATATLVIVKAIDGDTLDVQPMVAQIDGAGNATPHGIIHNVPFVRVQGGVNAVIIDPQVGDIGIAVFASRDVSSVKVNKAPSNPGSRRQFDMADALYIGGMLNAVPTRYVKISDDGIEIVSPDVVTITCPAVTIDGDLTVTGNATVDGDVTADGVSLHDHTHGGVQAGGANTDPPN